MEKYFQALEALFGKARGDCTVTARFGGGYCNGIKGWQFPEEILRSAREKGLLLTMDLDLPGEKCALNCSYCFAKAGEQTGTYYRSGKGQQPLSMEEIKQRLLEAKQLGLQSAKIIGYREPFENPEIFDFIDFATRNRIHLVIFTALYSLGEEFLGGGTADAIDFLAKHDVSLMVKMHSISSATEDAIVNLNGYAVKRNYYLKALLDDGGLAAESPTRLGIENVVSTRNIAELLTMYKYFKIYRNVFIDLDPPIPVGRTGTLAEAEKAGLMSQKKLLELCTRTYKINDAHGIPFKGISPYFGAAPCSQLPNSLYLTLSGQVFTCCGGDECIGNARKERLKEIFEKNPYRKKRAAYHNCPYREKRGIMTKEFIKKAEEMLLCGRKS